MATTTTTAASELRSGHGSDAVLKAKLIHRRKRIRVALLHSDEHTQVLHETMKYIHDNRDLLLESLLECCGFIHETPNFFLVVEPRRATRQHLERFHTSYYLDLLEVTDYPDDDITMRTPPLPDIQLLDSVGLVDDCPISSSRQALWNYCRRVVGGSLHAARLLKSHQADVALHWGGGRHHAHPQRASGFCYVNDVVVAIQHFQAKVLYLDIDIHHADGVQDAFYDTDQVMTVSFHRYAQGFFPSTGGVGEKGTHGTSGVGYNLNIPLPQACCDTDFFSIYQDTLQKLVEVYEPSAVVLCVGADGLKGDPLVGTTDGWNLTPEGLAECVRFTSEHCRDIKLLILGGGGYDPAQTARTFLLCTAAACESARPGMLRNELPTDIPQHEFFTLYGPDFRLFHDGGHLSITEKQSAEYELTLAEARKTVNLTVLFVKAQRKKEPREFTCFNEEDQLNCCMPSKNGFHIVGTTSTQPLNHKNNEDLARPDLKSRRRRRRKVTGVK